MPRTFTVGGVDYDFPDQFTDQQVQTILTKQGVIKTPATAAGATPPAAPPVPAQPGSQPPPAPPAAPQGENWWDRAKTDIGMGWNAGKADIAHTVANVAQAIPIPAVRTYGQEAEAYAQKTAPKPADVASHQGVVDQVLQGAAQVPSQVLKFAPTQLAGKYGGPIVGGLIGAAGAMDKGPAAALKAGAETAATFAVMHQAGKIKSLAPRVAANAAIMAVPTAIESGGDVNKTVAAGITGGAFGIPAHGEISPAKAREAAKGGFSTLAAFKNEAYMFLAPHKIDESAGRTGEALRERVAEMHHSGSMVAYALRNAQAAFDKMPQDQVIDFYHGIQNQSKGVLQETPELQAISELFRKTLDAKRDEVIDETGRLKHLRENPDDPDSLIKQYARDYFPQLWKDPEKAAEFTANLYAGKRPLAGTGARFKEKTFPTISDGLAAGLELANENPVQTVLQTVRDLDRFLMAKRFINDTRPNTKEHPNAMGIAKFLPIGSQMPTGYARITGENAFKVWGAEPDGVLTRSGETVERAPKMAKVTDPATGETSKEETSRGVKQVGEWIYPNAAAQVINNYLSPGLGRSEIYRAMRTVGNVINQAQLGLSAFHAGFTSIDSAVSRFALGMEKVVYGTRNLKGEMIGSGLADIVSTPVAPLTNAIKGYNLRKALRDPDSIADPRMKELARAVITAGGRVDSDPVYTSNLWNNMRTSFRQNKPLLGALQLPMAIVEKSASPLMNHFVPMQKLGVFADLARFEMDKMAADYPVAQYPLGIPHEIQRRAYQKAYDSVDNRMGQLAYDNLHWNKIAKDLGMLSIRSVGWNIGTIREVLGGAKDWASFVKDAATPGQRAEFTHRMAYVAALPMVVGTMGAVTNYLYTGEWPQTWKDYLAPRTGRKDESGHDERIWYPSYLKDVYHYMTDFSGTLTNKVHPMFGMVADMLKNEDFYGVQIHNPNDGLVKQAMDIGGYVADQFNPLSIRTMAMREAGPETPWQEKAASFIGVAPAVSSLKKSAAENYASKVRADKAGRGARTKEEDDIRQAYRQINAAQRAGTDMRPLIQQYAVGPNAILPINGVIKSLGQNVGYSPLYRDVKLMDLESALKVFKMATPAERAMLMAPDRVRNGTRPMLVGKILNEFRDLKNISAVKLERLRGEVKGILQLPGALNYTPAAEDGE